MRNVINEIEKLLTRFDLDGQPQPRFFERREVIPDFRGSRMASYLGTATCMLAAQQPPNPSLTPQHRRFTFHDPHLESTGLPWIPSVQLLWRSVG